MEQTTCARQAVSVSPPSWYCSTLVCIIQSFRRGNRRRRESTLTFIALLGGPDSFDYKAYVYLLWLTTWNTDKGNSKCSRQLPVQTPMGTAELPWSKGPMNPMSLDFWLTAQSKAEGPSFGGRCKRLRTKPMSILRSKPTKACISSLTMCRQCSYPYPTSVFQCTWKRVNTHSHCKVSSKTAHITLK